MTPATALMLDAIAEQSPLGQPFRIVVPVVVQPGEELSGECLKVVPSPVETGDDVPEIALARIAMERSATSTRLVVTTGRAVSDPAMRITLQVGCDRAVRREYRILFDPPLADVPVVGASAAMAESANMAPASALEGAAEPSPTVAAAPTPVRGPVAAPNALPAKRMGSAADRAPTRQADPRRSSSTKTARSRLAISRTVQSGGASGNGFVESFDAMSKSAQLAAVEEQEVVLRKRVAELAILVERMQQERIAALSAEVERLQLELRTAAEAQRASEEAARRSPWDALSRWYGETGSLVWALLAVAALVGGALLWRRRSTPSRMTPGGEPPIVQDPRSGLVDTYVDEALIEGRVTGPSFARLSSPNIATGHLDTASPNAHDNDFDHDVALQPRPVARSR